MRHCVARVIYEKYYSYYNPHPIVSRTDMSIIGVKMLPNLSSDIPEDACILVKAAEKFGDLVL